MADHRASRAALEFITPGRRLAALALVRAGELVPLGLDMKPRAGSHVVRHGIDQDGPVRRDACTIAPHGSDVTHVDAWSHVTPETGTDQGANLSSYAELDDLLGVHKLAGGVLTRGVLLDVASARGLAALPAGFVITPRDLDMCIGHDNRPTSGCAVFVRAGTRAWPGPADPGPRQPAPGLDLECGRWLRRHEVAVYAGDCIEAAAAQTGTHPYPLHAVCLGELGLLWLDNPDMERLREACGRHGRREFAVVIAPLPLVGMTGCAVNPLAVF